MHLHLNPIGGLAGDMFCAALLDARPDLFEPLLELIRALAPPPDLRVELKEVRELRGRRFLVTEEKSRSACGSGLQPRPSELGGGADVAAASRSHRAPPSSDEEHDHHHHDHTDYAEIRALLERAPLAEPVRRRAQRIFHELALAEAQVHGVPPDEVKFHEVGNWDSIVDIVSAAFLIESIGIAGASTEALPLGGGRVRTAHGMLPVPAPATALLLEGLPVIDDGIPGERVTPTGAAILRALSPSPRKGTSGVLRGSGYGFGTRKLDGVPNCVQALLFETTASLADRDRVVELQFEIDDQPAEDLAQGLDRLRGMDGVLSLTLLPGLGKQGRAVQRIEILLRPENEASVVAFCFRETATIGLRRRETERWVLPRDFVTVAIEGREFEVKRVRRPDGISAKVEQRSLAEITDRAERERLRHLAEKAALAFPWSVKRSLTVSGQTAFDTPHHSAADHK